MVKHRGRGTIANFTIKQGNGKIIEPWKGKNAEVMEWVRNSSVLLGDTREELGTFWKTEKGPIYYQDSMQADKTMNKAFFTSELDGREYDVAARLLDKSIKMGDKVKLTIMGCCSIIDVDKVKEEEIS